MTKHTQEQSPTSEDNENSGYNSEFDDDDFSDNSENNSNVQETMDKETLSSILVRISALEKENKKLKDEANKRAVEGKNAQKDVKKHVLVSRKTSKKRQSSLERSSSAEESDDIKNNESSIIGKDNNGQAATAPIPKPHIKKGRFANLHLKLNLEKSVYESYRTAFFDIIERHVPNEVQYKNLDKKIRAGIIRKFKKANPYFPPCIGDWALIYLMRRKINTNRMYSLICVAQ